MATAGAAEPTVWAEIATVAVVPRAATASEIVKSPAVVLEVAVPLVAPAAVEAPPDPPVLEAHRAWEVPAEAAVVLAAAGADGKWSAANE